MKDYTNGQDGGGLAESEKLNVERSKNLMDTPKPNEPDQQPEIPPCKLCGGEKLYLGRLGNLDYCRCRACGMLSSRRVSVPKRKGYGK